MKLNITKTPKAFLNSKIELQNVPQEFLDDIKEGLTFDNPKYATVKRFSNYGTTNVPTHLFYFLQQTNGIQIPIGSVDERLLQKMSATIMDERVYPSVKTPEFVFKLRDTQVEAAEAFLSKNKSELLPKGCIQLPTGKGKTVLGLYLAHCFCTPTLIVVHKDDLVKGWLTEIKEVFRNKVKPGVIKAQQRSVGDFLTVATIQTLNNLPKEELEELYQKFGFVILDEMHHCPATSFSLVSNFNSRYRLGLTATPERKDGLAHVMQLFFGDFCYRYVADENDTDILPVEVIIKKVPLTIDPILFPVTKDGKTSYKFSSMFIDPDKMKPPLKYLWEVPYNKRPKIPYTKMENAAVKHVTTLNTVIPDIVSEYSQGHSCVVFFTQKEHLRLYETALKEFVPEEDIGLYYGDNKNNDSVKEHAETHRKYITLTTYAKAREGTNVKQWEVAFLVSSINDGKNVEQAIGRVRRTHSDKLKMAKVYDYRYSKVYMMSSHSKTRDDRYYRLKFTIRHEHGEDAKTLFNRGFKKPV